YKRWTDYWLFQRLRSFSALWCLIGECVLAKHATALGLTVLSKKPKRNFYRLRPTHQAQLAACPVKALTYLADRFEVDANAPHLLRGRPSGSRLLSCAGHHAQCKARDQGPSS